MTGLERLKEAEARHARTERALLLAEDDHDRAAEELAEARKQAETCDECETRPANPDHDGAFSWIIDGRDRPIRVCDECNAEAQKEHDEAAAVTEIRRGHR